MFISLFCFLTQTERNRIKNFDLCYGTSLLHGFKSLVFTNAVNCVAEKIAILFESKLFGITHRPFQFTFITQRQNDKDGGDYVAKNHPKYSIHHRNFNENPYNPCSDDQFFTVSKMLKVVQF